MLSYISRAAPRLSSSSSSTLRSVSTFSQHRTSRLFCSISSLQPITTIATASPVAKSPTTSFIKRFFSLGSGASTEGSMAAKAKAQEIIDNNPVAVFSKSYCPYCRMSKQLLSEQGAKAYIIELDQVEDGTAIQEALLEITGQRTVPNIFIKQKHIGGNSDLQGKKSELPTLLKDAGAL